MKLSRCTFLKLASASTAAAALFRFGPHALTKTRRTVTAQGEKWVPSVCRLCPAAFGGVFSRLGLGQYLYLGELLGAILMFAGFLKATAPTEVENRIEISQVSKA